MIEIVLKIDCEKTEKAVDNITKGISDLVEKALKRYCQVKKLEYKDFFETENKLERKVFPDRESFFHDGVEIFRLEKEKKHLRNPLCIGSTIEYTLKELF